MEYKVDPLITEWVHNTCIMSSTNAMMALPEFKLLCDKGRPILDDVLHQLEYGTGWIAMMILAYKILGFNPVPARYAGRVRVMRDIWIAVLKEETGFNDE